MAYLQLPPHGFQVLVRAPAPCGFWRTGFHPAVWRLAAELHGTGMAPTRGLFGASKKAVKAASRLRRPYAPGPHRPKA